MSELFRPGVFVCAKCELRFYASDLGQDGTVSGSRTAQCLNECGPAWPVTWKAECLAAEAREDSLRDAVKISSPTLPEGDAP